MAEAILNRIGGDTITAYSAGSTPRGEVNPLAIELLQSLGYKTDTFRSKSWDEFISTPQMDLVITVCDNAANEVCPIWPGHPLTGHWGISDPDQPTKSVEEQRCLFRDAYKILETKMKYFIAQHPETLDKNKIKELINETGDI